MEWTLREKSQKEINDKVEESRIYSRMVKGIGISSSEVCPLEVTKSNGEVKDVWDLSEQEVFGLIRKISSEIDSGNRDKQREDWAFQITKCWGDKHPQVSPRMTVELMKLTGTVKTPVGKEIIRDFMGPLANKTLNEATIIANYLNGMSGNQQNATKEQIMQVLDNMASFQEKSQTK